MKFMTRVRFIVFFVVLSATFLAAWLWWRDGVAPVNPDADTVVAFEVQRGESVRSIISRLGQQGLIRSPTGFYILVKLMSLERKLQAGEFRLSPSMDAVGVARELTHGITDVWVTTLEGWRVEEIANKLAKDFDIPEAEFLKYAREGYMFPDTYQIPSESTASAIARMFKETFEKKVTDEMRADAKKTGLSFDDVIILASIVEREGRTDEDRPVIAGILLKRLKEDWPLQVDATLQYALGYQGKEKTWWKKELYEEDKAVQSPYNTYLHTGLPPTPIANPGLSAIKSVIYFKDSPYWYYLHDPNGAIHYGKTLEEHEANVVKYL